jgi:hypothetical protein
MNDRLRETLQSWFDDIKELQSWFDDISTHPQIPANEVDTFIDALDMAGYVILPKKLSDHVLEAAVAPLWSDVHKTDADIVELIYATIVKWTAEHS